MKEFCLVPVSIAEKYMFNRHSPLALHTKTPVPPPPTTALPPPPASTMTAGVAKRSNPPLHDMIRVGVPPSLREYGLSFAAMLDNKPDISWDEQGNLLPPFSGLNVIDLINSLGTAKGKIPVDQSGLISLLLRYARIPQRALRTTQKKKVTGGSLWLPY